MSAGFIEKLVRYADVSYYLSPIESASSIKSAFRCALIQFATPDMVRDVIYFATECDDGEYCDEGFEGRMRGKLRCTFPVLVRVQVNIVGC
jgi:hypothetical protein